MIFKIVPMHYASKMAFVGPSKRRDESYAMLATLFVTVDPLLARFAFFRLRSAIWTVRGVAKYVAKMCLSCLRPPWISRFGNS